MSIATEKKHKEIMMNNIFSYFFKRIRLDKEDILSCETVGDLVWKVKFFLLKENLSPCEWWYAALKSRLISKPNFHRWALISYSSDEYQKVLELANEKLGNPEMDNGITADDIEQYNDEYVGYVPDQYDPTEDESDDPSDFEVDHEFPPYDDTHDDSCGCKIIKKEVEKVPIPKPIQVPVQVPSPKPDPIMFPDAVEPQAKKPRGRPRKDGLPPGSAPNSKKGQYKRTGRPIGRPRLDGRPAGTKSDDDIKRFVALVGKARIIKMLEVV